MSLEDVLGPPQRPARKYRRGSDSVADLMAAGRSLLAERGLDVGLGRVTLNDAIERSGIPRSSAYRLYRGGDGPLESYRDALLTEVIEEFLRVAERAEALERVLLDVKERTSDCSPTELARSLREIIRRGVDKHVTSWASSVEWQTFASAMLASSGPTWPDRALITAGVKRITAGTVPIYREMAKFGGLRIRAGASFDEFASVVASAVEGAAHRCAVDPEHATVDRTTGPSGTIEAWSTAAIIFESLFVSYFVADPEVSVSADLNSWFR